MLKLLKIKYIILLVSLSCVIMLTPRVNCWIKYKFPLNEIQISGKLNFTPVTDISNAVDFCMQQSFLFAPIKRMYQEVESLPWVKEVSINRLWPDKVNINIKEHNFKVRFNNNDAISEDGIFLKDALRDNDFEGTYLRGPDSSSAYMFSCYQKLVNLLTDYGYSVSLLEIMSDGAMRAIINKEVEVKFGQLEFDGQLNRLKIVGQKLLLSKISQIAYIDLRYTNGVSIGWKPSATKRVEN